MSAVQRSSSRWLLGLGVGALVFVGSCAGCSLFGLRWIRGWTDSWIIESGDSFTDGLVVPEGYPMREPLSELPSVSVDDPRGDAFLDASNAADADDLNVRINLPSLERLDEAATAQLIGRLASDPRWHVGVEGRTFAYRRFRDGYHAGLQDSLNGFYSHSRHDPRRSFRVVLGFGGTVYADRFSDRSTTATATAGWVTLTVVPSLNVGMRSSYLVVTSPLVVVEIFEEGPTDDRPMTRAALELLRGAFADPALGEPTRGAQELDLARGMQGGIYQLRARVNPGEPGEVHVRAYEAIRARRLSADRMYDRTRQLIGGSSAPDERFTYTTELTIYEGEWGDYYPARIEVWFEPSGGGPERKLIEDTFRVEGWTR